MKKQDEGFTLIELLIVIVILGILATVVVFAVSGIRDQGDQSACETEFRAIQTALEAYYADADPAGYPATVSDASLGDYFNSATFRYFDGEAYSTFIDNADVPGTCATAIDNL